MVDEIKAKIELVTSSASAGGGQAPIGGGGNRGFQKALSVEKFKAAKAISSGTLGKILVGAIIAGTSALLSSGETETPGGDQSEDPTGNDAAETNRRALETTDELIRAAEEYGLGIMTMQDGTQMLVDSQGNLMTLMDIATIEKAKKTGEFIDKLNEAIPIVPKFISDLAHSIDTVTKRVYGAISSVFTKKTPSPITSSSGGYSSRNSTPENANMSHIKYGAVYVPPFVPGAHYSTVNLNMTSNVLNQDLINSYGQDTN